jgi:hypothetical protein
MTKDEVIRMARQADDFRGLWNEQRHIGDIQDFLYRFSALVAAHEREACARVCDDMVLYTGYDCAAAIRARGEKE